MGIDSSSARVFSGSGGGRFARKVCDYLGIELGASEALRFSEGNTFVRVLETVRGKDVFVIQPVALHPNDEFMELLFWVDAFKRASAASVTAVVPYSGYAKGDKKDEPRTSYCFGTRESRSCQSHRWSPRRSRSSTTRSRSASSSTTCRTASGAQCRRCGRRADWLVRTRPVAGTARPSAPVPRRSTGIPGAVGARRA